MPPKDDLLKVRLSTELKAEAEKLAADRGESLSLIVREALREYLEKRESPPRLAEDPVPYRAPQAPADE